MKRSEIYTIGGTPFTPDYNLTSWINEIPQRLATVDRRADPIHFAVTSAQFPELPVNTIRRVANKILEATDRYYKLNTRPGCVDPRAQNFDFQANFGDSSYCNTEFSHVDRVFGGIYQTYHQNAEARENLCDQYELSQVNTQTGDFSCPSGYTAVSLYNGTESYTGAYTTYFETCAIGGWGGCKTKSRVITDTTIANYETFWCLVLDHPEQYRGYLFGGFYTSTDINLVTGLQSCPSYYRVQKIAVDVSICVSNNYELGFSHAVGFAGFHSCLVGNPLSIPAGRASTFPPIADWPHNCPGGYSQHLVAVQDGCEISVCLENGAFQPKSLLPPRVPPFQTKSAHMSYATDKPTIMGSDGGIIVRNTAGQWRLFARGTEEATSYYELLLSNGTRQETSSSSEESLVPPVTTRSIQPTSSSVADDKRQQTKNPVSVHPTPSPESFLRGDDTSSVDNPQGLPQWTTYISLIMSTAAVALVVIFASALLTSKCVQNSRSRRKYEINNRCTLQSYKTNV